MPINTRFSKGRPRMGQWVIHNGDVGVAVAPMLGETPLDEDEVKVEFVDAETGFRTVGSVRAKLADLEPLTDIMGIPEPRRLTMAEGWEPRA